ncbi:MAG: cation-transporting P-type ATPase [Nitrospirae bacterium]|nr:cation-transporting P-type ATPase [Nitrospirota bacterium]
MIQTVHSAVPGRARYKVSGLQRSESFKKHLESGLLGQQGIVQVSISTLTGSVLVFFNSFNTHQSIALVIQNIVVEYKGGDGRNNGEHPAPAQTLQRTSPSQNISGSVPAKEIKSRGKTRRLVAHAEEQAVEAWHTFESPEILERLGSSALHGLSSENAGAMLKKFGPNLLPESVPRSGLSILIEQLNSIPNALLGVAAGLSVLTGGVADALVIVGVVGINAVIGYVTESQAERTIHSLKSLVRPSSLVVRDGIYKEVPAEEIVAGDILVLRPGSYVAADSRLIETAHLSIDESALTGESMPAKKTSASLNETNVPLADRVNMAYMGTLVTGGQGLAVVVATGKFTEIGKIQELVGSAETPDTPMERQLKKMGTQLVLVSGAVCGLVFVIGLLRGYGFLEMLKSSISLAVAAVPEGLPTVATTTLALGIMNMKKHRVLIRHLDAVETLGSVQTICMDKTGTITLNRMSVVAVHTGMKRIKVIEDKFLADGKPVNPFTTDEFLRLIHVAVLCNESEIILREHSGDAPAGSFYGENGGGKYVLQGSPTENALIHMAICAGVDIFELRKTHPLINIKHRSENRNFMASSHDFGSEGMVIAVKGSPNEVLAMCDWHIRDGEKIPISDDDRLAIETENERMAGDALRILGFAYLHGNNGNGLSCDVNCGFVWLGLVGMADPTRKGVKELIGLFHVAGIETVMITGDQTPTAYAIGTELDLSNGEQLEILDSTHLADIEPGVMKALSERVHVFARVSPAHKLQIVQALQSTGRVVAMTGDGINDGPALKAANIGIAMGHTGTDVAREVADIVLEDDNLETMIVAVSHGRTIYNNIRKSVHFLLATNLSEIMVMFTAIAAGLGQPLNAMQLLWINLISDIFPGLALALEPPEPDVLSKPPRNPDHPIIMAGDFKRITFESAMMSATTLGAYGYGLAKYGRGAQAGTLAFMSLTTSQLLHALSCRSEKHSMFDKEPLPPNRYLDAALGGSFVLQALTIAVPGIRGLLGTTAIGLTDAIVVGGSAVLPLIVNEATKKSMRGETV